MDEKMEANYWSAVKKGDEHRALERSGKAE
jgi:hypothetical protein